MSILDDTETVLAYCLDRMAIKLAADFRKKWKLRGMADALRPPVCRLEPETNASKEAYFEGVKIMEDLIR